jgi:lysophospholipase
MKMMSLWYLSPKYFTNSKVLYLSNSPWTAYTNYSFFQSTFYPSQLDLILENSFNIVTYANGSSDPQWPACLACALIRGSVKKMGLNETEQCQGCWARHCWNGQQSNKTVDEVLPVDLPLSMVPGLDYAYWNETIWGPFPD